MTKEINIHFYMKRKISNRIKQKRKGKKLKQNEVYPDDRTYLPYIENITSEKNREKTKNMLPDGVAYIISQSLDISMKEIYFGKNKDIEKLVKYIFYKVAFNFNFKSFNSNSFKGTYIYPKHRSVTKDIMQISRFYSPLSNQVFSMKYGDLIGGVIKREKKGTNTKKIQKVDNKDIFEYRDETINDLFEWSKKVESEHIQDQELKEMQIKKYLHEYKQAIDYLWKLEKEDIIYSFMKNFYNEYDSKEEINVDLNKINQLTSLWINTELRDLLKEIKDEYQNERILSMGFKVYDLNIQKVELTQEKHRSEEEKKYFYFKIDKKRNKQLIKKYGLMINDLVEEQLFYFNQLK